MEAASHPVNRKLTGVKNRIDRLAYTLTRADDMLTDDAIAHFEEDLSKLRKEKMDLEARRDDLNPLNTEILRLENYVTSIKRLLDRGGFKVEPDGIWAYAFDENGGILDAENFGTGLDVEQVIEKVNAIPEARPKTIVGKDGHIDFDTPIDRWAFEHPDEARVKGKRAILRSFDAKVLAFPDRLEIQGMIPTETMLTTSTGRTRGQEFNSAYWTIS